MVKKLFFWGYGFVPRFLLYFCIFCKLLTSFGWFWVFFGGTAHFLVEDGLPLFVGWGPAEGSDGGSDLAPVDFALAFVIEEFPVVFPLFDLIAAELVCHLAAVLETTKKQAQLSLSRFGRCKTLLKYPKQKIFLLYPEKIMMQCKKEKEDRNIQKRVEWTWRNIHVSLKHRLPAGTELKNQEKIKKKI